jgi:hypothetical protein
MAIYIFHQAFFIFSVKLLFVFLNANYTLYFMVENFLLNTWINILFRYSLSKLEILVRKIIVFVSYFILLLKVVVLVSLFPLFIYSVRYFYRYENAFSIMLRIIFILCKNL